MDAETENKESKAVVKKEKTENVPQLRELLENPLVHLPIEKKQELIEKATEKAFELEADKAERMNKHNAGWADVHRTVEAHSEMSKTAGFSGHKISGTYEVGSGYVKVEGAKGKGCLVSIVAFFVTGMSIAVSIFM